MDFLTREEAKSVERKLLRQIAERPKPKRVLYYQSGKRDYAGAAQAIVAALDAFTKTTVLYLFAITGDGWGEFMQDHEGWRAYRTWRKAAGETRRLYDAPGHQFGAGEADHLVRVIASALELGWDALVAASPKRQLALLSHDDRMEIYRGFEASSLSKKLVALGYWRHGGARARDITAGNNAAAAIKGWRRR
jgi:hypothetical protein